MIYTIKVTEDDIKKGIRSDAYSCPIFIAMRRVLPKNKIAVACYSVIIDNKQFYLPENACKKIEKFDSGKNIKPFTFDFDFNLEVN